MKINKVDHISIAVKSIEKARPRWEPLLGKTSPDDAYIDAPEKIKVARYYIGEVGVELMESLTPDGEVARFIEKNGEGIMLISFNVDKAKKAKEELQQQKYPVAGDLRPFRDGEYFFIHPQEMNGVLVELIDDRK